MWLRMGKSGLWLIPGRVALMVFAYLLMRVDTSGARRAYAAHDGIYNTAGVL
jgi:small multidrug resistance family-3 protein